MNALDLPTETRLPTVIDAGALLAKGIESGLSLDALERLLSMRRELQAEQARACFFQALSRFQSAIPVVPKNHVAKVQSSKGCFSYRYADLADIQRAIAPSLVECGLSFTFDTIQDAGGYVIQAKVHHTGGHSEVTTFRIPVDTLARMSNTQAAGSSLTYGRRYALTAALGIVTAEDDDDGEDLSPSPRNNGQARPDYSAAPTAPDPKPAPRREAPPPQTNGAPISARQHTMLEARITSLGLERERVKAWILRAWGVEHIDQVPADRMNELLNRLGIWSGSSTATPTPPVPSVAPAPVDEDWFNT